ncbi:hypothetical protein PAMP_014565 [Pampus punctatissimus]
MRQSTLPPGTPRQHRADEPGLRSLNRPLDAPSCRFLLVCAPMEAENPPCSERYKEIKLLFNSQQMLPVKTEKRSYGSAAFRGCFPASI